MAAPNNNDCGERNDIADANPIEVILDENRRLKENCILMQQQMNELQNEIIKLRSLYENVNPQRKIPRAMAGRNVDGVNSINVARASSLNNNNISNINISNSGASSSSKNNYINVKNSFNVVKRKKKILQAVDVDLSKLNNHLKNNNCVNYTIKQSGRNAPVKIAITDESEIAAIKSHLNQANVSFREYMWDHEKKKAFIIKGFVGATANDMQFIKNQLVLAGLPEQISVSLFESGFMRANTNQVHNSLVQMIVPPNTDIKLINGIKYLDHVAVKIEPLKNSKQCKNCQRFGHSAGGCQHGHRCVKCGANHYKVDCPRTIDKLIKLMCCNCGGEHTANNINDCPYAQQIINSSNNNSNNKGSFPKGNIKSSNRSNSAGHNFIGLFSKHVIIQK